MSNKRSIDKAPDLTRIGFVVFALSALSTCMTTERDFSLCNDVSPCLMGFRCVDFKCVEAADGGGADGGGAGGLDGGSEADGSGGAPACEGEGPCVGGGFCVEGRCVSSCAAAAAGACAAVDANKPLCNAATGACVACLEDGAGGTSSACPSSQPFCVAGACTGCKAAPAGACAAADGAKPICDPAQDACVGCTESAHCTSATAPICRGGTCTPCEADGECAMAKGADPGVCLSHLNGRCAGADEVVYTRDDEGGSCVGPSAGAGAGTLAKPYCNITDAVAAAVAQDKPAVVFRGPVGQVRMTFNQPGKTLLVVGQQGAALEPGASGPGIEVTSGTLYARSMKVEGSSKPGVVAKGANAVVHLQAMYITDNAGGILIDGAGFTIDNTIIAGNKVGTSGETTFGGLLLRPAPNAPKRLRHVTVVNNSNTGIACSAPLDAVGVLVTGHDPNVSPTCQLTPCCTGALSLSPTYRLTSASTACLDKVPPAMSLPIDIDETPRPQGAQGDCGAHELRP